MSGVLSGGSLGHYGVRNTGCRSGRLGPNDGDILRVQQKSEAGSGSTNNGYLIHSDNFFPFSDNSTIKIEMVCSGQAATSNGRPLNVARFRWNNYGAGNNGSSDLSGHNDWGERSPNHDGNDRGQVDVWTFHKNTSLAGRTYSFFMYGEYVFSYGAGDSLAWQSGDRYMTITEYAGAPGVTSEYAN